MPIDFDLPTDAQKQLLVGALFAESSTKFSGGGEDAGEKTAITQAFINMAFYAGKSQMGGKKCYNNSYGDGTILSALKKATGAYGKARWNLAMSGDRLKSKADLEKILTKLDIEHLKNCVAAVEALRSTRPSPTILSGASRCNLIRRRTRRRVRARKKSAKPERILFTPLSSDANVNNRFGQSAVHD